MRVFACVFECAFVCYRRIVRQSGLEMRLVSYANSVGTLSVRLEDKAGGGGEVEEPAEVRGVWELQAHSVVQEPFNQQLIGFRVSLIGNGALYLSFFFLFLSRSLTLSLSLCILLTLFLSVVE